MYHHTHSYSHTYRGWEPKIRVYVHADPTLRQVPEACPPMSVILSV